jgi:uncharacterized membrane protein YgcG
MAVSIPIVSEFDSKGIKSAINEFKSLEGAGAKAQFALKKAAVPAAAALAGLAAGATLATKAAMEDLKAQELLAQALKNTTNATDEQIAANEQFIAATERAAAVSDEMLRPALGNLVRATGDVEEAQNLLAVALDISAATGSDLESVSIALSKAANGQVTALQRLGIPLDENAVKAKDFDKILGQLSDTFGGAASASANSYEGQMRRVAIAVDNTKENIGMALIPVVERLLPVLDKAAQFVQNNTSVLVALGATIAAVSAAVLAINLAMKVYTASLIAVRAAQWAFNAAVAANPIGAAIVVTAAFAAGLVYLESKTQAVSNSFARWGAVLTQVLGPLYAVVALIGKIFNIGDIKLPSFDSLVPKFNVPSTTPGTIAPRLPSPDSGPDLLERKFLRPETPGTLPVVPIVPIGGGGGGGGGRGIGGGGGGIGGGGDLVTIMGGGGGGLGAVLGTEAVLDGLTGGGDVISVTVNTVTAPADLGDTIVDALVEYNRRSGPLQLEIA